MDGYECIGFIWLSVLTALYMARFLSSAAEVPKGQEIKPTIARQVCMFGETCGCEHDCFSDFATKENRK